MSADVLVAGAAGASAGERVVPSLASQEAWRLLRHPLMLAGFVIFVLVAARELFDPSGPREAFATVDSALTYFPGLLAILAANLVATRDHRAGSDEVLSALPGTQFERTRALCLASVAPALVGLVLVLAVHSGFLALDRYELPPSIWHLLQAPVTVLGACLFGIMVARWLPFRGAPLVALVALVAVNVWSSGDASRAPLGPMTSWPEWGITSSTWAGLFPGSPAWHVAYLLGLCGLAASAAAFRDAPRRWPVLMAGLGSLVVVVVAGTAQLP